MNHQDIADRLEAIVIEHMQAHIASRDAIDKRYQKERESLEESCGGIGHVYVSNRGGFLDPNHCARVCCVCGKAER